MIGSDLAQAILPYTTALGIAIIAFHVACLFSAIRSDKARGRWVVSNKVEEF